MWTLEYVFSKAVTTKTAFYAVHFLCYFLWSVSFTVYYISYNSSVQIYNCYLNFSSNFVLLSSFGSQNLHFILHQLSYALLLHFAAWMQNVLTDLWMQWMLIKMQSHTLILKFVLFFISLSVPQSSKMKVYVGSAAILFSVKISCSICWDISRQIKETRMWVVPTFIFYEAQKFLT